MRSIDYIQELRKHLGHRPLIMVGASTLMLNPLSPSIQPALQELRMRR